MPDWDARRAAEARTARRRRFWRFALTLLLVGGTGIGSIALTFVPWGTNYLHQSKSGWQLFLDEGTTFDIDAFGYDESGGGSTGIGTLLPGVLLVGLGIAFLVTFDSSVASEYGEVAYPRAMYIIGRVVGVVAVTIMGLTSFSHISAGFTGVALAMFFFAVGAGFGIFALALPRRFSNPV